MNEYYDKIEKEITKKYGDVLIDANMVLENEPNVIPVGPAIDIGLHGGIPEGSWVILSGAPKAGKTTLALQFAANCQKPEYGEKTVYYLNAEGRFKKLNLEGVDGLDANKLKLIQSKQGKILSAEDFLTIASNIIKDHPGCVVILDSASALSPEKDMVNDISGQTRAGTPKLLSAFCKQMGTIVPIQNTTMVIIQHLIANTSGYGPQYMEDGGRKIQYQADIKLRAKSVKKWTVGNNPAPVGQIVSWTVQCSALGPPGAVVDSYIRYGRGIDSVYELINLGADLGLISKAGAWFTCDFMTTHEEEAKKMDFDIASKFQGQEKLYQFLTDNPICRELLHNDIKNML